MRPFLVVQGWLACSSSILFLVSKGVKALLP